MPEYEQFEKRHEDSGNYMLFIDTFVRRVVGCTQFDKYCDSLLLSKFVTVSDEGFALLVYENQEKRWQQLFKKLQDGEQNPKITIPGKYTDGGTRPGRAGGTNREHKGWKNEGLHKFNSLCLAIEKERQTDERKKFEARYLNNKREGSSKKKKKKRKKVYEEEMPPPTMIYNEMEKEGIHDDVDSVTEYAV